MSRCECQSNFELCLTHTHSHYIFALYIETTNEQPIENANDEAACHRITETSSQAKYLERGMFESHERRSQLSVLFPRGVPRFCKYNRDKKLQGWGIERGNKIVDAISRVVVHVSLTLYSELASASSLAKISPRSFMHIHERGRLASDARCKCVCNGRAYVCTYVIGVQISVVYRPRSVYPRGGTHYIWSDYRVRVRLLRWRMREPDAYPWHRCRRKR